MNIIWASVRVAINAHHCVYRKYTGRPYIEHPARVAAKCSILFANHNMFDYIIGAAYCHDVVEDNPNYPIQWFWDHGFDSYQISLITELTNPSKGSKLNRSERKAMDREHLSHISSVAKIIKLVDRLDNINDMSGADSDFKKMYFHETKLLVDAIGNCDGRTGYDNMSNEQFQVILDELKKDINECI